MELGLTDAEGALLLRLLRHYLGDLRMEIRDTDLYSFRQGLKEDEAVLTGLIQRLESGAELQVS